MQVFQMKPITKTMIHEKETDTCMLSKSLQNEVQKKESKQKCASRESNAGPIDGNDGFYHQTTGTEITCC